MRYFQIGKVFQEVDGCGMIGEEGIAGVTRQKVMEAEIMQMGLGRSGHGQDGTARETNIEIEIGEEFSRHGIKLRLK